VGIDAGVGEPWFDTLEGAISHGIFSIPGIKGIEFGGGFALSDARGSEYNDAFRMKDGRVVTETNNNGGINGGISNGMPVIFRTAVKATPSIYKEQRTVDIVGKENKTLEVKGRHDPAIIHRSRAVVDAVTAIVLADLLVTAYGTDYLAGGKR
jgi:chorismate synthase